MNSGTVFFNSWSDYAIAALLCAAVILLVLFMISAPRRRRVSRGKIASADGQLLFRVLKASYRGDKPALLSDLKKAVRIFPEEVMFYVWIGDLIRDTRPEKAATVHRGLLFRKNMTAEEKAEILRSLGLDYLMLGEESKALSSLRQSNAARKDKETIAQLMKLERDMGLYEDAVRHRRDLNKLINEEDSFGIRPVLREAMNRYAETRDIEDLRKWFNQYKKYDNHKYFTLLAQIYVEMQDDKEKRAEALAREFMRQFEAEELSLRYVLLKNKNGAVINDIIEGKWKDACILLRDQSKAVSTEQLSGIPHTTAIYAALYGRMLPPGEAKTLIMEAGKKENWFICMECGASLSTSGLLCPACSSPLHVDARKV